MRARKLGRAPETALTQFVSATVGETYSHASPPTPKLNFVVEGSGAGLVLFHELGGSLESWAEVVPLLHRQFRILRFDQRGHGRSEKTSTAFSMEDHARDAEMLSVSLQRPLWLVGVAAGAAAAVEFARLFPEITAGLVLCAPALFCDPSRIEYLQQRSALAIREGIQAIEEASLAQSYPMPLRIDEQRFLNYRARWLKNDPVGYGLANEALMKTRSMEALTSIGCPCLVVAGAHDLLRPSSHVKDVASQIAGAHYVEVDSGHLMPVQAPREIAALISNFVREQENRHPYQAPITERPQ